MTEKRTPTHCPHCGYDGAFGALGEFQRQKEVIRSDSDCEKATVFANVVPVSLFGV